ncbi:hypothetical protein SBBP1_640045 [Burkholderiales bacterium]|nr:hypothetical protein SBBP1_640045 [Burkholderiales bacterium]
MARAPKSAAPNPTGKPVRNCQTPGDNSEQLCRCRRLPQSYPGLSTALHRHRTGLSTGFGMGQLLVARALIGLIPSLATALLLPTMKGI